MYTVSYYQDLNGDGIHEWPDDGGDLFYAEMRKPTEELTLGGGGSLWLTSGEEAEYWAYLYAYGWKGGIETIGRSTPTRSTRTARQHPLSIERAGPTGPALSIWFFEPTASSPG